MSSPTAILASPKQDASFRRWLLAFFAPTFAFAFLLFVGAVLREMKTPGGTVVIFIALANGLSIWFCLREVVRVPRHAWQRCLLAVATIVGLALQTIVDVLFFGLLSMELWGFPGPS